MIEAFLGAMTPDGYNPIASGARASTGRWSAENPWSNIGYWGDHPGDLPAAPAQAAQATEPGLLPGLWDARCSASPTCRIADRMPSRSAIRRRSCSTTPTPAACARAIGADGLMGATTTTGPCSATLAEKLAIIVLAKAGSLVPAAACGCTRSGQVERRQQRARRQRAVDRHARAAAAFPLHRRAARRGRAFDLSAATWRRCKLSRAGRTDACRQPMTRRHAIPSIVPERCSRPGAWTPIAVLPAARRPCAAGPARRPRARSAAAGRRHVAAQPARRRPLPQLQPGRLLEPRPRRREPRCTRCSKARWRCCRAACCRWARRFTCSTRCSPARCSTRGAAASCSIRTAAAGLSRRNRLDGGARAARSCSACSPPAAPTCCSARRRDRALRARAVQPSRPRAAGRDLGQRPRAARRRLRPPAEPPRLHRPLGHHVRVRGAWAASTGTWWPSCCSRCRARVRRFRRRRPTARAGRTTTAACATASAIKTAAGGGARSADPYSHTAGEGGAQQPGMTGRVKEEILTRWGELGLRFAGGLIRFDPVLLDGPRSRPGARSASRSPACPHRIRLGAPACVRRSPQSGGRSIPQARFDPRGVGPSRSRLPPVHR